METPQRGRQEDLNFIARLKIRFNMFQQRHAVLSFPYAVIKKYGDDEAAYEGALITYYGFLSLFPLLIVATSLINIVARHDEALRGRFIAALNNYFPIVGDQLQSNVHSMGSSGAALVIGILITLYGARGGAAAVQHALNHVWQVPRPKRAGFPKAAFKSLSIIVVGGVGLLTAAVLSSLATSLGHSAMYKLIPSLISIVLLFGVFSFIFKVGTDGAIVGYKGAAIAALVSAIGLQILQTLGGYYITHELKGLRSLYGTFALVLGLLAWIYLQAQLVLYALEIASVKHLQLWPRSLDADDLTEQDKRAYELYAQKERYAEQEDVEVYL
jgi:membrane protein